MEGRIYFKINVAEEEKIATFAARSGRTGKAGQDRHIEIRGEEKKEIEKIKFILFAISEKFLTFALPTIRKWGNRNGGCQEDNKKRLR